MFKVFVANFSPLDLFSDFLGHKSRVQYSLIDTDSVIISKCQSGSRRREKRTKTPIY